MTTLRAAAPHLLTLALCLLVVTSHAETAVPMGLPAFARYKVDTESEMGWENSLSYAVGQHLRGTRTVGSDQNFELDTFVHAGARSPLTMTGISNLLVEPGGYIREARSNSAGGHIAGQVDLWRIFPATVAIAPGGSVGTIIEFGAAYPAAGVGEKWSFVDRDPESRHVLRGRTLVDRIDFPNGWALMANGDSLELHDARGIVHIFR